MRRILLLLVVFCAVLCILSLSAAAPLNFINTVFFKSDDVISNDITSAEISTTSSTTVVTGNMQSKQMFVPAEFQGVNLPIHHQNLTRRGQMDGFIGLLDSKWNVFTHVYKVFSTISKQSKVKVLSLQIDSSSPTTIDAYIMGTLSYGTSVTAYFSPTQSIPISCRESTTTFVAKISDVKNNWFLDPLNNDPVALLDWILVTHSTAGLSRVLPTGLLLKPDTKASVVALFNFFDAFNTTTTYFDRNAGNLITQQGSVSVAQSEMESAMLRLSSSTGNLEALAALLGNGYDQTMNFVSSKSGSSIFTSVFTFSTNITIVQFSPASFVEISRDVLNTEEMYSYAFLIEIDWSFRLVWSRGFRQYLPDIMRGGMIDTSDHYIVFPISFTANVQPLEIEGNTIPFFGEQDAVILLFDANTKNLVNVKHIGSPASDSITQAKVITSSNSQGRLYFIGTTSGTIDFGNQLVVANRDPVPTSFLLVVDTNLNALNISVASYASFNQLSQLSQYEVLLIGKTDSTQLSFQSNVKGGFLSFYGIYPTVYQARRYDSKIEAAWNSMTVDGTSISQFEFTHSADAAETSRQTPVVVSSGNFSLPTYPSNGVYYIRLRPVPSALTPNTPFSAPIPIYSCPLNYEGSVCQFPKCYAVAADLSNTCNSVGVCYQVNTCYCGSRFVGQNCGDFKNNPVFLPNVFNNTLAIQTTPSGNIEGQKIEIPILAFSNATKTLISDAIITLDNETIIVNQVGSSLGIEVNSQDMNVERWDGVSFNRATFSVKAAGSENIVGVVVGNGFQIKTASSVLRANLCIIKSLNPSSANYYVPAFAKLDSSVASTYRHAASVQVTEDRSSGQARFCARVSNNEMYFPALLAPPSAPSIPVGSSMNITFCIILFVLCLGFIF